MDINGDGVAELFYASSGNLDSPVTLCGWVDNEVKEIGRIGSYGSFRFWPKKNVIYTTYSVGEISRIEYNRINENSELELICGAQGPFGQESEKNAEDGTSYQIGGEVVSREAFDAKVQEVTAGAEPEDWCYFYENDGINDTVEESTLERLKDGTLKIR